MKHEPTTNKVEVKQLLQEHTSFGVLIWTEYHYVKKIKRLKKSNTCLYFSSCIVFFSIKRKDFLEIDQSETRIACGGHVW
jgi:hypothetical protein